MFYKLDHILHANKHLKMRKHFSKKYFISKQTERKSFQSMSLASCHEMQCKNITYNKIDR